MSCSPPRRRRELRYDNVPDLVSFRGKLYTLDSANGYCVMQVSTELTLLETASREKAREISLDARTTDPLMSVFFHKGLLIDSHCPPRVTRSIANYCRMRGWLQRSANAAERVRDPGDELDDSRPVFVERSTGKFEQLDLVIVGIRHEVLCLVVSRRTPEATNKWARRQQALPHLPCTVPLNSLCLAMRTAHSD